jgi:hypothetical protein
MYGAEGVEACAGADEEAEEANSCVAWAGAKAAGGEPLNEKGAELEVEEVNEGVGGVVVAGARLVLALALDEDSGGDRATITGGGGDTATATGTGAGAGAGAAGPEPKLGSGTEVKVEAEDRLVTSGMEDGESRSSGAAAAAAASEAGERALGEVVVRDGEVRSSPPLTVFVANSLLPAATDAAL